MAVVVETKYLFNGFPMVEKTVSSNRNESVLTDVVIVQQWSQPNQ